MRDRISRRPVNTILRPTGVPWPALAGGFRQVDLRVHQMIDMNGRRAACSETLWNLLPKGS